MANPTTISARLEAALLEKWAAHMSDEDLREAAGLDSVLFDAEVGAAKIELQRRDLEVAKSLPDKELIEYVLGLGNSHQSRIDQIDLLLREGRVTRIDQDILEGVREALYQKLSNNIGRDYKKFLQEEGAFMRKTIEEKGASRSL